MKKNLLIIFCLLILTSNVVSQDVTNYAPIKWQSYKISEEKVKIMFPKLPVRLDTSHVCEEIYVRHFYAYADEVVYEMKIIEKSKEKIPAICPEKEFFSAESFTKSLSIFQSQSGFENMQKIKRGQNNFVKFDKSNETHKFSVWFLNDFENLRWFEFSISTYKEKNIDENLFIDSLQLKTDEKSIEINNGAETAFGDELIEQKVVEANTSAKSETKEEKVSPLMLVVKPKPKYTDEARKGNVTGNVRMRVTFLENGSIGSVQAVNDFDAGLTEQAMIATRKMAFLPMKRNGKSLNVTKVVVYNFSLY